MQSERTNSRRFVYFPLRDYECFIKSKWAREFRSTSSCDFINSNFRLTCLLAVAFVSHFLRVDVDLAVSAAHDLGRTAEGTKINSVLVIHPHRRRRTDNVRDNILIAVASAASHTWRHDAADDHASLMTNPPSGN